MSADVYAEDGYYAVVPEWVLDADISAQAVRLYAVLRRYADHRSREAHPSRRTLATRLRVVDLKVVDRALADLQRIGAVEVFGRKTEAGDRDSNGYLIKARGEVSTQGGGPNHPTGGGSDAMGVGVETPQQEPQPMNHSQNNHKGEPESFAEFWAEYPTKRGGRKPALASYVKALKSTDHETIMRGLRGYRFAEDESKRPHAQTWLNQERWTVVDELPPTPAATALPERPTYRTAEEARAAREAYEASERARYDALMARKAGQA